MDKVKWLSRYHRMEDKIKYQKEFIEACYQKSLSLRSPSFDTEKVDGGTKKTEADFAGWIITAKDAEMELVRMNAQLVAIKSEILSVLHSLSNQSYAQLLFMRFIEWKSWTEIDKKLNLSVSTRKRWYRNALEKINI